MVKLSETKSMLHLENRAKVMHWHISKTGEANMSQLLNKLVTYKGQYESDKHIVSWETCKAAASVWDLTWIL